MYECVACRIFFNILLKKKKFCPADEMTQQFGGCINYPEPVFLNLFMESRNQYPARRSGTTVLFDDSPIWRRPARLHRLAESILWNRFLGSLNVYKYGLWPPVWPVNWLVGIIPPPPFPNHHGPPNRKSINKANDTAWKKGIFSQSDKVRIKNDGSLRFFPQPIMMSWTHVLKYLFPLIALHHFQRL